MKRVLSLVLCSALVLSTLTGCGGKKETTGETGSNSDNTTVTSDVSTGDDTSAADSGEITNIIWQYPSAGDQGSGFQDVEDALNKMMEKDIGVHVTFEPVGLADSQKDAILMTSSGEQLDICLTAFTSLAPLVDGGLVYPLDDLLAKDGKDLTQMLGTNVNLGNYNSKIYGIPPADRKGNAYGYLARTDLLEKYGIIIDSKKKYTPEDVENIFATIKAGEGDNFYCTIPWNTTQDPLNNSFLEYDKIGGTFASGVLMLNRSIDDLTVTNFFATDEYAKYTEMMYRWAQKGYISPDAAVTTESPDTLIQTGNYLGMFYWSLPTSAIDYGASSGHDLTLIPMIDGYVANNGGGAILWSIPITSVNPDKAMQALNYLYSNPAANWLIQFGIEGVNYKVVNQTDEGTQIQYLSDDYSKLPYYNPYGLWGNILEWPVVAPAPINKNKLIKDFDASIPKSRYSAALGYNFVQTNVTTEIAAVNTVIDQYTPSFNSGALDSSKALPEFLDALKAAGIDKIIAENQKQLDEWAATQ
ncbi:MAG: ABC transporter substrate-binding protein [Lachnotalea sp.]